MRDESEIWQRLKAVWPGWVERVEVRHPPGVPDVMWAYRGEFGWLELKCRVTHVRPEQKLMIRKMAKNGVRAFVLSWNGGMFRLIPWWGIDVTDRLDLDQALWAAPTLSADLAEVCVSGGSAGLPDPPHIG